MSKISIKEAALALLSKGKTSEEATKGFSGAELHELEFLMKSINKKTGDGRYGRPNPDVEMKEVLKTDKQGQWKIEKAIKPGPTIDYSKFNQKPDYAAIEAKAPTINYSNKPNVKPTWTGASDKAAATRAKIDAEANESASETMARRQKMNKEEGANSEPELTADKQKRMVAKNATMGYGDESSGVTVAGNPGPAQPGVAQSEKEPHKDDPRHEEKEKKKARQIKDKAEDLLDMHKADKETHSVFTMQHSHDVASMPHDKGKAHLHNVVDASSASPENKTRIKHAINGTKNSRALSGLVANHVLAAGGGGHKTGSLKVIS